LWHLITAVLLCCPHVRPALRMSPLFRRNAPAHKGGSRTSIQPTTYITTAHNNDMFRELCMGCRTNMLLLAEAHRALHHLQRLGSPWCTAKQPASCLRDGSCCLIHPTQLNARGPLSTCIVTWMRRRTAGCCSVCNYTPTRTLPHKGPRGSMLLLNALCQPAGLHLISPHCQTLGRHSLLLVATTLPLSSAERCNACAS
jgi:hypothetical protein